MSCLFVLLALLSIPSALAESKDKKDLEGTNVEREKKERAAMTACLAGDVQTGVALLAELYVSYMKPAYLFNQGRCFQQNGRYADAIARFREYQRKIRSGGGASDDDADGHIQECEALLNGERPAASTSSATMASPPALPPKLITPSPMGGELSDPRTSTLVQPALRPAPEGAGLRIAGLTTALVGTLGVGVGVLFNLEQRKLVKELESLPTSYNRSNASTQSTYKTVAGVSYMVGAACLVGGAVLYTLGSLPSAAPPAIALGPVIGQDTYAVALQGVF